MRSVVTVRVPVRTVLPLRDNEGEQLGVRLREKLADTDIIDTVAWSVFDTLERRENEARCVPSME